MSELEHVTLNFYGWWQAATCFFAFLALMAIWWHLGRLKKDYAQLWLAFSVLCWSLTGFTEVYFSHLLNDASISLAESKKLTYSMSGYSSLLSLGNSFFILLSLPWFKHIPSSILPIVRSKYWKYIVGLPFVFSLLPTISKIFTSETYGLISELDVYYSILTLGFLGLVLWESFAKRRLKLLAYLSLVCILITFLAQVYKISGSELDMRLFSAIFKSTLIMIFFALAMSWVKDLSESLVPSSSSLGLHISNDQITMIGIPGKDNVSFIVSPASKELLMSFVNAKLDGDKWLEIKPKSVKRNEKEYPIKDHNEIKRLTYGILDGIYGKNNWTKEQHEVPFKEHFYETPKKEARKVRLNIPKENINF